MKLPNNKGDRTPTRHILSSNEAFSTGNGLHQIELLAKGTQAIVKAIGGTLQIDNMAPLLNTTPT